MEGSYSALVSDMTVVGKRGVMIGLHDSKIYTHAVRASQDSRNIALVGHPGDSKVVPRPV